jgi:acetyl esterase/lipase
MLPGDQRDRFLRAGYVVVAIDYRLAPETRLPEILEDIEDAHRWVRDQGPTLLRIDPRRVVAVGQSGGGYLALMAGVRVQPRLKAVVSFYGYGDIAGEWYSRPDAFYLAQQRVTKEDADKMVGEQALSESPPLPRIGFYVYCRQNGRWPHEVAGLDPDTEADKFEPYCPERLVTSTYPPTLLPSWTRHCRSSGRAPHAHSGIARENAGGAESARLSRGHPPGTGGRSSKTANTPADVLGLPLV